MIRGKMDNSSGRLIKVGKCLGHRNFFVVRLMRDEWDYVEQKALWKRLVIELGLGDGGYRKK